MAHVCGAKTLTRVSTWARCIDAPHANHRPGSRQGARISHESPEDVGSAPIAARVQQSLLPPPEMHFPGLRVASAFHPCTDLAEDGNGLVAPASLAWRLNRQFPMDRTRLSFTLVYGTYDGARGLFRYVVAGHPSPVLLPRSGPPVPIPGRGLPIGTTEHATCQDETVILQPGDRLQFYTDGVLEAPDASDEEFGPARLVAELEEVRDLPLREGLELVTDAVRDWTDGGLMDDVSLLAIERVEPHPGVEVARGPEAAW